MSAVIGRPQAYLCLAASMALVGSYVGLSKWLVAVFPVFLLAGLRFALAAVAMVGWMRRPAEEPALDARDHLVLFLGSFFGNFLFSICMLFGVQATSALAAGVVMAGIPAAVALLSWAFLGERLNARIVAAIACAGLGVALLAFSRHAPGAEEAPWWGYALLLAAVGCEAAYVVVGKRLTAKLSAKRISALINLWGLALVAPLALWQGWGFEFSGVGQSTWTLLLFYALAASMGTVWLWMRGMPAVPAQQAGLFTVLLPISAAGVGIVLLGEQATALHGLALGLALAGIYLATRTASPQ
ncbi:drug/metabolite transporter (DMT)-like permease [Inhella inkyongensis]|uniref:Drug/metabolite transporter (DMT)-like permease n=1 Tax=Inhella inkyongensis TaxID=392593 RepID=A0A840S1A9_9BURK|nr:DMT family transporter [Inhella inkyongensis]MBB5204065.1 drug/metabolite transporter (DMT)-like permease [Inhella inkyongensis]